jgi:3-hydroxyisobutyrate dehydrogenase
MAERVAVLGTGIVGAPMARNLLKAGFPVSVWNRTLEKARALAAEGADVADTPADAVRDAAFVITMLTDNAAVLAVMRQAESVPDGAVWLQTGMDTDVEYLAGLAEDHGVTFVHCPVLGTRDTARRGRLIVLASGPGDVLDRAQPIFDAIARRSGSSRGSAGRAAGSSWRTPGSWRSWRPSVPS